MSKLTDEPFAGLTRLRQTAQGKDFLRRFVPSRTRSQAVFRSAEAPKKMSQRQYMTACYNSVINM